MRGDHGVSRLGRVPRLWRSSAATVLLSAAVAVTAACGGGGATATDSTEPVAPDRLSVTLAAAGAADFRLDLDCSVADRDACAGVLAAIAAAEDDEECTATADDDEATMLVSGTIGGEQVRALLGRRTDCEIRAYDAAVTALGL